MKLNINKARDLSSISVLPPHSRRSNPASSGMDSSGSGQMRTYHLRSQSQQPFSQGTSLSQLSQSSLDEVLTNEQRLDSQERDNTAKRVSYLAPLMNSRDESQMQQSRSSNYVTRRWNPTFIPDSRCRIGEELEHRIGLVESSLTRLEKTMDSVQSDLMLVNKGVKEVSLEVAGIRKKMIIQDGHMQLMLKGEEDIKASVSELKSIPDLCRKEEESADQQRLHKIAATISSLPTRIEASLLRLQNEISGTFTKEMEKRSHIATGYGNNQRPVTRIANGQPKDHIWVSDMDTEAVTAKVLIPKTCLYSNAKHSTKPKQEEIILTEQVNDIRMITESDEEIDGGFACLLVKKETGWKSHLSEEARKESVRILRKARRRKRKLDNIVLLD